MQHEWLEAAANDAFDLTGLNTTTRRRLVDSLVDIARANGGTLLIDRPGEEGPEDEVNDTARTLAVKRALEPFRRYVHGIAASMRSHPPVRIDRAGDDTWTVAAKVNLNRATHAELEALPDIGDVFARRVLTARQRTGRFRSLDQLDEIEGIGPRAVDTLRAHCYVGAAVPVALSESAQAFVSAPSIARYQALRLFEMRSGLAEDAAATDVIDELIRAAWAILDAKGIGWRSTGGTALSRIARRAAAVKAGREHLGEGSVGRCGLIRTGFVYEREARRIIEEAADSVDVAVFYMLFVPEDDDYPANALITALADAAARGVTVRVIVDRDRPFDVYKSRLINAAAVEHLEAAGVAVRQDEEHEIMHAKLVTGDQQATLVGSHNWTAGSLRAYDDTSVLVEGDAQVFQQWFEELWAVLDA